MVHRDGLPFGDVSGSSVIEIKLEGAISHFPKELRQGLW